MNLVELKTLVDNAIENAKEYGDDPADILVSIQIDDQHSETLWSEDVELTYDSEGQASGCVLHGWAKHEKEQKVEPDAEKECCRKSKLFLSTGYNFCPRCGGPFRTT